MVLVNVQILDEVYWKVPTSSVITAFVLVQLLAATIKQYPKDTPENCAKKMKEFKVIGMDEEWNVLTGAKSNKQLIEQSLNSYGLEGWSVKAIAIRQIPGIGTITYENLLILERDMPLEA
jgi:hypothetical protein